MTQFRNIKIKGIKASMAKSGKSAKVWIANKDVLVELGKALEKRPTWKTNGYDDDEREFLITNYGISEIYDDGDDVPPNYPEEEETIEEAQEDKEDVPF